MKKQDDTSYEWFQVNVTFGNFADEAEAKRFKERMSQEYEYVSAEIKGSWS